VQKRKKRKAAVKCHSKPTAIYPFLRVRYVFGYTVTLHCDYLYTPYVLRI